MEGADIYQIAENCRTSVEMIEKYYAAHIKTSLDAAAINVMRPKKNKRGKKAIQNTQVSPQPLEHETVLLVSVCSSRQSCRRCLQNVVLRPYIIGPAHHWRDPKTPAA